VNSPFESVQQDLNKALFEPATRNLLKPITFATADITPETSMQETLSSTILPALTDLHAKKALPAIISITIVVTVRG
jgi:hypothetical protein